MKISHGFVAAAALVAGAGVAHANVLATFSYSKLDGSFDGASSYSAVGTADSLGLFDRLAPPAGSANFGAGDVDFSVSLSVDNIDNNTADGVGSLTITDVNGVTFTGDINGGWSGATIPGGGGSAIFFVGVLDNIAFSGATFEGSSGSFSTDFGPGDLIGSVVTLFIETSGFFSTSFSGVETEFDGQIVPTPAGALALLGLGGLAAARRRR